MGFTAVAAYVSLTVATVVEMVDEGMSEGEIPRTYPDLEQRLKPGELME